MHELSSFNDQNYVGYCIKYGKTVSTFSQAQPYIHLLVMPRDNPPAPLLFFNNILIELFAYNRDTDSHITYTTDTYTTRS